MASKMNPGFMAMMAKKKDGAKPAGKMMEPKGKPFAKGGMTKMGAVKTAAPSKDGMATKGKTQGKMIKMTRGGKTC
jgi:hypothetical protein